MPSLLLLSFQIFSTDTEVVTVVKSNVFVIVVSVGSVLSCAETTWYPDGIPDSDHVYTNEFPAASNFGRFGIVAVHPFASFSNTES